MKQLPPECDTFDFNSDFSVDILTFLTEIRLLITLTINDSDCVRLWIYSKVSFLKDLRENTDTDRTMTVYNANSTKS